MDQTLLRRIETNDQTLEVIDLPSEREVRQFISAVPDNSNIQALGIKTGVAMNPEVATALSAVLPRMPFLSSFMLFSCDCSNTDGLSILASALANRDSLKKLGLVRCHIDERGAEIIASSLSDNTTLKSLIFFGNSIGKRITHFKRVLYNDASIDSVLSSNHTLKYIHPGTADLESLLKFNRDDPEKAVRSKIIRFLNEQPTFVLTMGVEMNVMPSYMEKIGRDCQFNTMFELIRNVTGLFEGHSRRPEQQSRKRSRS